MFLVELSWLWKLSRKARHPRNLKKTMSFLMFLVELFWLGKLSRKPETPKTLKNHLFFKVLGGAVLALEPFFKGLKSQKH